MTIRHTSRVPARRSTFFEQACPVIRTLIEQDPFQTGPVLQCKLESILQRKVSLSLCHTAIQRAGLSHKRATHLYKSKRLDERVAQFRDQVRSIDPRRFVFVDETGIRKSIFPLYGYSPKGAPLRQCNHMKHKSVSAAFAINHSGVLHRMYIPTSFKTHSMVEFFERATFPDDSVVVMDNVSMHKTRAVLDCIERRGWSVIFTPPASPDFNPIENFFGVVKHQYRKAAALNASEGFKVGMVTLFEVTSPTSPQRRAPALGHPAFSGPMPPKRKGTGDGQPRPPRPKKAKSQSEPVSDPMDVDPTEPGPSTSSSTGKRCRQCDGTDHERCNTSKCPKYRPLKSSVVPLVDGRSSAPQFSCFKQTMDGCCLNPALRDKIQATVEAMTQIQFEASRLLNLHILRCIEQDLPVPVISKATPAFIRQCFTIVEAGALSPTGDNEKYNEHLVASFRDYQTTRHADLPPAPRLPDGAHSQLLTLAVNAYATNCTTHLNLAYWRLLRRFCAAVFPANKHKHEAIEACLELFEKPGQTPPKADLEFLYPDFGHVLDEFRYSNDQDRFRALHRLSHHVRILARDKMVDDVHKWIDCDMPALRVTELQRQAKLDELTTQGIPSDDKRFTTAKSELGTTKAKINKLASRINWALKQLALDTPPAVCTIVPLCTAKVKYVKIDTVTLWQLLDTEQHLGLTWDMLKEEGEDGINNQDRLWRSCFKLRSSLFQERDVNKKLFNYEISTDGIGCTIGLVKFVRRTDHTETTTPVKTAEQRIQAHIGSPDPDKTTWIGIDPGVGSIFTAVIQAPGHQDEVVSFSNGHYQHMCGHKSNTDWHNTMKYRLSIETWMSTTPSPKVSSSEAFKVHLTHVLRPELRVQLDFHLGKKARHHRFTGHKRRQVAVDRMCKAVLKHAPIRTDVVIAFGNASWRQGKGYASSPRRQRFARYFEQFEHHRRRPNHPHGSVKVASTNEFNTSQVCSKCLEPVRLEGLDAPSVANSHFVRSCKNPSCRTVWNRDVNAARNMITSTRIRSVKGQLRIRLKDYITKQTKEIVPLSKEASERAKRFWEIVRKAFLRKDIDAFALLAGTKAPVPYPITIRQGFQFKYRLRSKHAIVCAIQHPRVPIRFEGGCLGTEADAGYEESEDESSLEDDHDHPDGKESTKVKKSRPYTIACVDRARGIIVWDVTRVSFSTKPRIMLKLKTDLTNFVFLSKFGMYCGCSYDKSIKFFNARFELANIYYTMKAVQFVRYNSISHELVTAGSHNICPTLKYEIETDLSTDEWITSIYLDEANHRMYAIIDTRILICCILHYSEYNYTIIACADGSIKIKNLTNAVVHEFTSHTKRVTGLAVYPFGPIIMSCALDMTVRMYNLKNFKEVYCFHIREQPMGIEIADKAVLNIYTREGILAWNLNHINTSFSSINSQAKRLVNYQGTRTPCRILAWSDDSVIRLISPATGKSITTVLPLVESESITALSYCPSIEKLFIMLTNSEIWVIATNVNPCLVVDIWRPNGPIREDCTCICVCDGVFQHHQPSPSGYERSKGFAFLFGGTGNGQVLVYTRFGVLHNGEVTQIIYISKQQLLITGGADELIKICTLEPMSSELIQVKVSIKAGFIPRLISISDNAVAATSDDWSIHMFQFNLHRNESRKMPTHLRSDDHTDAVTAICPIPMLGLFISSSRDGTLRLWDSFNTLIREVQFTQPLEAVCVNSERGDILVGIQNRVDIIQYSLYLPPGYIATVQSLEFPEMPVEPSLPFDDNQAIWKAVPLQSYSTRQDFFHAINLVSTGVEALSSQSLSSATTFELETPMLSKEHQLSSTENIYRMLDVLMLRRQEVVDRAKKRISEELSNVRRKDQILHEEYEKYIKYRPLMQRELEEDSEKAGYRSYSLSYLQFSAPITPRGEVAEELTLLREVKEIQMNEAESIESVAALEQAAESIQSVTLEEPSVPIIQEVPQESISQIIAKMPVTPKHRLKVAPDGEIPNSVLSHNVESWRSKHTGYQRAGAIRGIRRKKKEAPKPADTVERKKKSDEYKERLKNLLENMAKKEEEEKAQANEANIVVIEDEDENEAEEEEEVYRSRLPANTGLRNVQMYDPIVQVVAEKVPMIVQKALAFSWFPDDEKINPTPEAIAEIIVGKLWEYSKPEIKLEMLDFINWIYEELGIRDTTMIMRTLCRYLQSRLTESMDDTDVKLREKIIGVLTKFSVPYTEVISTLIMQLILPYEPIVAPSKHLMSALGIACAESQFLKMQIEEIYNESQNQLMAFNAARGESGSRPQTLTKPKDFRELATLWIRTCLKNYLMKTLKDKDAIALLKKLTPFGIEDRGSTSNSSAPSTPAQASSTGTAKTSNPSTPSNQIDKSRRSSVKGRRESTATQSRRPTSPQKTRSRQTSIATGANQGRPRASSVSFHPDVGESGPEDPKDQLRRLAVTLESSNEKLDEETNEAIVSRPVTAIGDSTIEGVVIETRDPGSRDPVSILRNPSGQDFVDAVNYFIVTLEKKAAKEEQERLAKLREQSAQAQRQRLEAEKKAQLEEYLRQKEEERQARSAARRERIASLRAQEKAKADESQKRRRGVNWKTVGQTHQSKCHPSRETLNVALDKFPSMCGSFLRSFTNEITLNMASLAKTMPMEHVVLSPFGEPPLSQRILSAAAREKVHGRDYPYSPFVNSQHTLVPEWKEYHADERRSSTTRSDVSYIRAPLTFRENNVRIVKDLYLQEFDPEGDESAKFKTQKKYFIPSLAVPDIDDELNDELQNMDESERPSQAHSHRHSHSHSHSQSFHRLSETDQQLQRMKNRRYI
ncbi:uncharacterized protein BJ171DRAFT_598856 [Polychytrium aggregatum]|uniref:uncharacterized protein n=1 Tax=Polychytrium aggregatum TaxID=110093 RepID=UPI0022FE064B|nr:uncharacterized protein BJ171DRAFT_598856 [Polychytrium aggregatum]KAI9204830.1 hypothetical protein BJ171DRAFT_598856 [Polychytrium aggregatum]